MILPDWHVHEGNGPHLLLVHGFLSSRSQWLLNLEALAAGLHAGNSGAVRPPRLTEPGRARLATIRTTTCGPSRPFARSWAWRRWFLLGYSMGAGLTLRYALDYPDRTMGHLFTNSTSGLADNASRQEELSDRARRLPRPAFAMAVRPPWCVFRCIPGTAGDCRSRYA